MSPKCFPRLKNLQQIEIEHCNITPPPKKIEFSQNPTKTYKKNWQVRTLNIVFNVVYPFEDY